MYKTIVVHVDRDAQLAQRTAIAARLADTFDAHVVGSAATGVSRDDFFATEGTVLLPPLEEEFTKLVEDTRAALAPFAAAMRSHLVASWEERVMEDDPRRALVLQSRYADLMVVGRLPEANARAREFSALAGHLALHCPRPVLVIPDGHIAGTTGSTAVIGWDGSVEACRAVAAALPLLRGARHVTVAVIDAQRYAGRHGEEPGADVALYLARHGVKVEVVNKELEIDEGQQLLDLAKARGADLIVAGAYGHSRFREWFIGGVTRTLLHRAPVPLLLAH